jgi:hypothetical protein
MKRIMQTNLLVIASLVFLANCKTTPKPETKAWNNEMQGMAKDVRELIPFLYDKAAFREEKNRSTISADLKSFSEHVHKITPKAGEKVSDDPLVSFSLENLESDLKRSYQAFEANQVEYSRTVAKSSLNNCFRCHSVDQNGAATRWELQDLNQLELSPIEKSDLLVATRKYDQATKYMEGLIGSDDFLQNHPFDYESILRRYLALIIRAENAPSRALLEMDKVIAQNLPHYIQEQVQGWRVSLQKWIRETKKPNRKMTPLKQAAEHVKQAAALQTFPQDHAGDVEYLRATTILHDLLKRPLSAQDEAQAFFLLGKSYEVLDELGSWNLHEVYFEACVKKAPKSEFAKICYSRLENSIYQGYSGSSGTHIPPYEHDKLQMLKQMM